MDVRLEKLIARIAFVFSVLTQVGCTLSVGMDSLDPSSSVIILGSVKNSSLSGLSDNCSVSNEVVVKLHKLSESGEVSSPLSSSKIAADGTFAINMDDQQASNISFNGQENVSHVLVAYFCSKTESRPLTGYQSQVISPSTNLLMEFAKIQDPSAVNIGRIPIQKIEEIIGHFENNGSLQAATNEREVFDWLLESENATLKSFIEDTFKISDFSSLKDLTPPIVRVVSDADLASIAEMNSVTFSPFVSHWYGDHTYQLQWYLDEVLVSNSLSPYSWTPTKNSKVRHQVKLLVGLEDGAGGIDGSKATIAVTSEGMVVDSYPAIPPPASLLTAGIANSGAVQFAINTGDNLDNCATFSKLAVSESLISLGLTDADFTLDCNDFPSQTVNYSLSPGDGTKIISLWARDAQGRISQTASSFMVVLDTTAPVVEVGTPVGILRGGSTSLVSFSAYDVTSGLASLKLRYSTDGIVYSDVADVSGASYLWTVPGNSTTQARLKLVAVDSAGNSSEIVSSVFAVDATPPSPPAISLTSGVLTASPTATFSISTCADTPFVHFSESSTVPALDASGWTACTTGISYQRNLLSEGSNTIYVRAKDAVGNISEAAVFSVVLDTTGPSLVWVSPMNDMAVDTSVGLSWKVTELHSSSAQNITLEYSDDEGGTWTTLNSQMMPDPSASNSLYSYTWTTPSVVTNGRFRLTAGDSLGNSRIYTRSFVVESTAPVLTGVTLAGGAESVGLPSVSVLLSVTESSSKTSHMRLAESEAELASASWSTFNQETFTYNLSNTAGLKTLYAQVKNSAGFISNVVSSTVTLEFGTPPDISVTAPLAGGSAIISGETINIQWICTPTGTTSLAANPISLFYTTNDGVSYTSIASGVTNSGSYSWNVPSGITESTNLRIMISCKTAAGVVASASSEMLNSLWKVLIGNPGNMDYGVHINAADLSAWRGVHGDSSNNLYSGLKEGIVKVDRKSGIVEEWLGSLYEEGCPDSSSTGASIRFKEPRIVDITNDQMTVLSGLCRSLTRLDISTKSILWIREVPELNWTAGRFPVSTFYLKENSGYLYFPTQAGATSGDLTFAFYELDLSATNTTARRVIGNNSSCSKNEPTLGSSSLDVGLTCDLNEASYVVVAPGRNKIYHYYRHIPSSTVYYKKTTHNYDPALGHFVVTANTPLGSTNSTCSRAVQVGSNTGFYICGSSAGQGRGVGIFDVASEAMNASSILNLSTFNNSTSMQVRTGSSASAAYVLSPTTNQLFEVKHDSGVLTQSLIGGTPFFTYGNGTDPKKVAFTYIVGMAYSPSEHRLYVRGINHLRRIFFDPATLAINQIDTAMNGNPLGNSIAIGGVFINQAGTKLAVSRASGVIVPWSSIDLTTWSTVLDPVTSAYTVGGSNSYYSGGTNLDYSTLSLGTSFAYNASVNLKDWGRTGSFLSDDNLYFLGSSSDTHDQDLWIFQSTGSTITPVAGAVGPVGAVSIGETGAPAIGTPFSRVYGMQPSAANGFGQTDLLVFDGPHLRKISFVTESSSPKIYEVENFAEYPNYPGDLPWTDAAHDLATGWSYFSLAKEKSTDGNSHVWAAHRSLGFSEISLGSLNVGGLTPSGGKALELEITPAGLLMLDYANKRILSMPLKSSPPN